MRRRQSAPAKPILEHLGESIIDAAFIDEVAVESSATPKFGGSRIDIVAIEMALTSRICLSFGAYRAQQANEIPRSPREHEVAVMRPSLQ
jgi:hypothetical protein